MLIRRAVAADAEAISELIHGVAHFFTLHPDGRGAAGFLQTIAPDAIRDSVDALNVACFVGEIDLTLVGVVAMRDNVRLDHLVVADPFQGRGLGRSLWEHVRRGAVSAGNRSGFTADATPFAVPICQRFGFETTGPRVDADGVARVPMRLLP